MSRPTYMQQEALADFLVENPGIAKGFLRTAYAKLETKNKWEAISRSLNALGGAQKDGRGWAKYWADKKCALKKICAQNAHALRATGGGGPIEKVPVLTPIDHRLVAVMGGPQFATGDYQLAIDPFTAQNVPDSRDPLSSQRTVSIRENLTEALRQDSQNGEMVPNAEVQLTDLAVPTLPLGQRDRSPVSSVPNVRRRSRSRQGSNDREDRNIFADIEKKRVEAEQQTAEALREATGNIKSVATAINNLAAAIKDAAQVISQAIASKNNQ